MQQIYNNYLTYTNKIKMPELVEIQALTLRLKNVTLL